MIFAKVGKKTLKRFSLVVRQVVGTVKLVYVGNIGKEFFRVSHVLVNVIKVTYK